MQHARFLTPALCKSLQDFCKGQSSFVRAMQDLQDLQGFFYLMRAREKIRDFSCAR